MKLSQVILFAFLALTARNFSVLAIEANSKSQALRASIMNNMRQRADGSEPKPICTKPEPADSIVFYQIPGYPIPSPSPANCAVDGWIYIESQFAGIYSAVCGSPCTFSTSVDPKVSVGGISCIGNTDVKVNVPGKHVTMNGESGCIPCSDAEIQTSPEDKAALMACGIASKTFGPVIDGLKDAGLATKDFFQNTVGDGVMGAVDKVGSAFGNFGNMLGGFGNKIGNGIVGGANKVGDFFSGVGGSIGGFFKG